MEFFQEEPTLKNQFEDDRVLRLYLEKNLSEATLKEIVPDLKRFGQRVATDILAMAQESEANPPVHVPYDAWGKRVDEIKVSRGWNELDKVSAVEGIVAIGYERKFAEESRLYQFAKLYLFHPSSAIYSCPLAMTDGAARLIEMYGSEELKNRAFKHLTTRDPSDFWTSGQWMTERTGGSDVSGTQTVAKKDGSQYKLFGVKWFTSATTSQMAMTLAKIEGDTSGKLSLFYLELRNEKGELQNIQINRLKDKLGTKALPTAELTLTGTPATLVGEVGKGVKTIATLFNVTRLYNACCAVGYMRRGLALATNYAEKREAFGKKLIDHGLHVDTLADLQARFELSFHLTFHAVKLQGKDELKKATQTESQALRLLIPLVKLHTAKEGVAIASEVIESFGGAGYIEDTGLPQILRNAQVLAIWEGTTNVLSLDAQRAIKKENAGEDFIKDLKLRLENLKSVQTKKISDEIKGLVDALEKDLLYVKQTEDEDVTTMARTLAFNGSNIYGVALLLEQADWELEQKKTSVTLLSAKRIIERGIYRAQRSNPERRKEASLIISSL
jgi:putative acyl-CoA dehydrogenase